MASFPKAFTENTNEAYKELAKRVEDSIDLMLGSLKKQLNEAISDIQGKSSLEEESDQGRG